MKNIRIVLVTIIAVMLSTTIVYAEDAAGVGDPCPQVILPDIQTSQAISINEISKGKVTAIVFMQTADAVCRKELERFKNILDLAPELNVIVISVDVGIPSRVNRYVELHGFPFIFLHDPLFSTPRLFGFSYTPATVILDKAGNIIQLSGGLSGNHHEQKFLEFLQAEIKK